jgi:FkbM family methyltransferase
MNLVFDIGSNVGTTVEFFSQKANKVVGFEPNPRLVEILRRRFNNRNVIIDSRGLSNEIGEKKFRIANADTISTFSEDWVNNSRFTGGYSWNEGIIVETTTLDSVIEQYGTPDYIKIDVEGYEFEVLTSLTKVLENTIISFEWAEEQKNKIEQTIKYLFNLGYKKFSYTEADKILMDVEIDWRTIDKLNLIENLDDQRKDKWGMIYVKK